MTIEEKLELLRKEWLQFPEKRDIIVRQARALEIARDIRRKKTGTLTWKEAGKRT